MSAVATSIFKVRAWCDFLANTTQQVSFRKGQAFYVLSSNPDSKMYFVSTQYSTPFSRTAVCGLVPISCFEVEDLYGGGGGGGVVAAPVAAARSHSKRVAADQLSKHSRSKPSSSSSTTTANAHAPHPVFLDKVVKKVVLIDSILPSPDEPSGTTHPMFELRVTRYHYTHTVKRMFDDFIILHNALARAFSPMGGETVVSSSSTSTRRQLPPLPAPIVNVSQLKRAGTYSARVKQQTRQLAVYIQDLFHNGMTPVEMLQSDPVFKFLAPRSQAEMNTVVKMIKTTANTSLVDTFSQLTVAAKASQKISNIFGSKRTVLNPTTTTATTASKQTVEFSKLVPAMSHATTLSKSTSNNITNTNNNSVDSIASSLQKQRLGGDYSRTAELFSSYFASRTSRN